MKEARVIKVKYEGGLLRPMEPIRELSEGGEYVALIYLPEVQVEEMKVGLSEADSQFPFEALRGSLKGEDSVSDLLRDARDKRAYSVLEY